MEGVKAPESYGLLLVERGFVPWPATETRPSPLTNQGPRPKAQGPKLHHVAISRAAPTERQAGETSGVNDPDSV